MGTEETSAFIKWGLLVFFFLTTYDYYLELRVIPSRGGAKSCLSRTHERSDERRTALSQSRSSKLGLSFSRLFRNLGRITPTDLWHTVSILCHTNDSSTTRSSPSSWEVLCEVMDRWTFIVRQIRREIPTWLSEAMPDVYGYVMP